MTDMQDARRGAPLGVAPKITTYTGASYTYLGAQPPDPNGAVDRDNIVEFINGRFTTYAKGTGTELWHLSAAEFWINAGVSAGSAVDPRIVFIPDAGQQGQWLAVQLDMGHRVLMATTDPTGFPYLGRWKGSAFTLPGNDFTMLGYDATGVYIGLNVAYGQGSPASAISSWMGSSGHRANILNPGLQELGTAVAHGSDGRPYWVQVFGSPR